MRDTLDIGPAPSEEDCAQIGVANDAGSFNRIECRAYIAALEKVYGNPPAESYFRIKGNLHDFGIYYEVQYVYDLDHNEQSAYAEKVEAGLKKWADADFWRPVMWGNDGQPISVISDIAMLDRTANPQAMASRQTESV